MAIVRAKLGLLLLLAVLAGCKSAPPRSCVPSRFGPAQEWTDLNATSSTGLGPHSAQRVPTAESPRNILALTGGGMYGAFTAGVLNGWTETGTRPTFDVVTGVSTGALIATYAFLGPEYDAELKRLFTTTCDRDIFRIRRVIGILRADSVATSEPLQQLIEAHVTPELLECVARAHAQGRRLYIGTGNLDTRQLIVWDMGAIASRGEVQLYRDIILASASIPGFFPPVPIEVEINGRRYTELHADGGIASQVFVHRPMFGPTRDCGATVWVISAGKLKADPSCTGTRTLDIGMSAINGMIFAQTRNDINRIAALAHETKSEFRLTALPDNFPVARSEQYFDPVIMGKLFDIGFTLGRSGAKGWRSDPPAPDDLEAPAPRTGTLFVAPETLPK